MRRIIIGVVLILLGISALTGVSLLNFIVAFILIWVGIRIIARHSHREWRAEGEGTVSREDSINEVAVFSSLNKTVVSDDFRGGRVVLVFAGGEVDLSQAKTTRPTVDLEVVAVFGGGKLIIPKGWSVNSSGASIFGGVENRTEKGEGSVILNLKGTAVFGGIEVGN